MHTIYMKQNGELKELISPSEQAKQLGVAESTLRARRTRGQLDAADYVYIESGHYQYADTFDAELSGE